MSAASRSPWIWCPTTPALSIPGFSRRWPPIRAVPPGTATSSATVAEPVGRSRPTTGSPCSVGRPGLGLSKPAGNPGQWYLHLFDVEQPDLNWDNPEVFDDLEKTLRFWLERGVDGFRIDVAHGMPKPPGLPDMEVVRAEVLLADMDDDPRFNNDGVHEIHRQIRRVFDDYPDAVAIGEVWVYDNEQFSRYVRHDELHLGFNFRLLRATYDATDIREAIENSLAA